MFKKILINIRRMFSGEALDDECNKYVDKCNPQTIEEREALVQRFWMNKARKLGYF